MTWPMYLRHQVEAHGRVFRLSPLECELVLILLLRRGRPVPVSDIVEALWPDPAQQPDTWHNVIWQRVYQLRRMFGTDAILTVNRGLLGSGFMIA